MNGFTKIKPEELVVSPFKLILKDWMLVTAGPPESYNTMTAGWGGLGAIWGKYIAFVPIRPQRYTYEFVEREENFTLSFFDDSYKTALQICGAKSGRDTDKAAEAGITPIPANLPSTTAFAEARLLIECRKIYFQDLEPKNFLDPSIEEWYGQQDYHRVYYGEVLNVWKRNE